MPLEDKVSAKLGQLTFENLMFQAKLEETIGQFAKLNTELEKTKQELKNANQQIEILRRDQEPAVSEEVDAEAGGRDDRDPGRVGASKANGSSPLGVHVGDDVPRDSSADATDPGVRG